MSIESKVAPLVLEKLQQLANSFDEELKEADESEKEARRLLNTSQDEYEAIRIKILDITYHHDQPDIHQEKLQRLAELENVVTDLLEQQQQIQLLSRTQLEENKQNGHMSQGSDDIGERLKLARQLVEEQEKRKNLVLAYRDARARVGAGENVEKYRTLVHKAVDQDVDTMDDNLDTLVEQLTQQAKDTAAETIDC
jgi:hypothetical protein